MHRPSLLLWNFFRTLGPVTHLLTSKGTGEGQLRTRAPALVSGYSAFSLPRGQRGAGIPPPKTTMCAFPETQFGYFRRQAPILPASGLKYFGKVLGQGGNMKYKKNLNSRFLMQNIYHLYQK